MIFLFDGGYGDFLYRVAFETVDDEIAASLRGMGPAKRLALVFQAERFARDLMRAGARNRHPEWNEADVEKEVARLWADAQSASRRWNISWTESGEKGMRI